MSMSEQAISCALVPIQGWAGGQNKLNFLELEKKPNTFIPGMTLIKHLKMCFLYSPRF